MGTVTGPRGGRGPPSAVMLSRDVICGRSALRDALLDVVALSNVESRRIVLSRYWGLALVGLGEKVDAVSELINDGSKSFR